MRILPALCAAALAVELLSGGALAQEVGPGPTEAKPADAAAPVEAAKPTTLAVGEVVPLELTLVPLRLQATAAPDGAAGDGRAGSGSASAGDAGAAGDASAAGEPATAATPATPPSPAPSTEPTRHAILDLARSAKSPFVVLFWSARCPVSRRYAAVYRTLVEDLGSVRFGIVCPNSNETTEAIRKSLAAAQLAVPTFRTADQATSDRLRVLVTPTVLLFDSEGTLRYRGPIDDDRRAKETERVRHLRLAIEAVLAGEAPATNEARAFGSSLRR